MGRNKHKFSHICQVAPVCPHGRAHWCNLTNTTEASVCCGNMTLCQITLTTSLSQTCSTGCMCKSTALWSLLTTGVTTRTLLLQQGPHWSSYPAPMSDTTTSIQRQNRRQTHVGSSAAAPRTSNEQTTAGVDAITAETLNEHYRVRHHLD